MIDKLCAMGDFDRTMYLDLVYADEGKKDLFHSLLKTEEGALRDKFLGLYSGNYREKLDRWIGNAKILSEDERRKAVEVFEPLFGMVEERKKLCEDRTKTGKTKTLEYREVMKAGFTLLDDCITDQMRGMEYPPLSKPTAAGDEVIPLPAPDKGVLKKENIFDCIADRKSRRKFAKEGLTRKELSYLLWATQGIRQSLDHRRFSYRTVPSGGARHPFETYLAVFDVEGLQSGLYRYLPFEHSLVRLFRMDGLSDALIEGCKGQVFAGNCAVTFIWSVIPYRAEFRYLSESKKIILQDSGHLCQNLYLAAESIDCGVCGIGAYDQKRMDDVLRLDGQEEFVIYIAPVGRRLD